MSLNFSSKGKFPPLNCFEMLQSFSRFQNLNNGRAFEWISLMFTLLCQIHPMHLVIYGSNSIIMMSPCKFDFALMPHFKLKVVPL